MSSQHVPAVTARAGLTDACCLSFPGPAATIVTRAQHSAATRTTPASYFPTTILQMCSAWPWSDNALDIWFVTCVTWHHRLHYHCFVVGAVFEVWVSVSSEDPSCRFPNVLPGTRHRAGGRWGHSASLQLLHIVPCPYHSYHLTHTILTLRQIDNVWDARLHVFVDGWFKLYANQTDHQ